MTTRKVGLKQTHATKTKTYTKTKTIRLIKPLATTRTECNKQNKNNCKTRKQQ